MNRHIRRQEDGEKQTTTVSVNTTERKLMQRYNVNFSELCFIEIKEMIVDDISVKVCALRLRDKIPNNREAAV